MDLAKLYDVREHPTCDMISQKKKRASLYVAFRYWMLLELKILLLSMTCAINQYKGTDLLELKILLGSNSQVVYIDDLVVRDFHHRGEVPA
jgi:hypothetical protein